MAKRLIVFSAWNVDRKALMPTLSRLRDNKKMVASAISLRNGQVFSSVTRPAYKTATGGQAFHP
jgi:hypothetical protein